MNDNELTFPNNTKHEVEQFKTVQSGVEYLKKLEIYEDAARVMGLAEQQNDIAEEKIRTQIKIGKLIPEEQAKGTIAKRGGDRDSNVVGIDNRNEKKLHELGITRDQSSDWQRMALLPTELFEAAIFEGKKKELTTSAILKAAKQYEREQELNEQREQIEKGLDLPEGLFDVVVIDPPWNYGREYDPESSRVANPYPEMSLQEIMDIELPVKDDSILFLWTTHQFLPYSFDILNHWGFNYKATMVWDKEKMGMGYWLRMQCEFCLLGIKGNPLWVNTDCRDIIRDARRDHSRKPEQFYNLVDTITYGRKLDYFSREAKEGWVTFGNNINKFL